MTLPAGTRLGPYEILAPLGAGGMGEVYRARDTKLNRDVAIKMLPESVAADPMRLARFEREARTLAALNHPHIAQIYGIEDGGGSRGTALVMELVPGQTLAERMSGGAVPVAEALEIARQIADALECAHAEGIVHRDLKPANIKVRDDGAVKVLDFGLAKGGDSGATVSLQDSPTFTSPAMTEHGIILGTAAYMSPEQARGKPIDKRADIWAFGVILFEMLTGKQMFAGETVSDTLAAVLREDVPWPALSARMPPSLRRVLERCLQKDPKCRLRDIGDAKMEIEDAIAGRDAVAATPPSLTDGHRSHNPWIVAAAALVLAAAAVMWAFTRPQTAAGTAPETFSQLTDAAGEEGAPAMSPDGTTVVFASRARGTWDLYAQRVGGRTQVLIAGDPVRNEKSPAFSPDGQHLAFHEADDDGGIFVAGATGESVRRVSPTGFHPSWSADGRQLLFNTEEIQNPYSRQRQSALMAIDAAGGTPRVLDQGDAVQGDWSPSGRRIVFWSNDNGQRDLYTIPAEGGARVPLVVDAALDWCPVWAADGRSIVFASDRGGALNLWSIAIDETTGEARGAPAPMTNGVQAAAECASFSSDGARFAFRSTVESVNPVRMAFDPATLRAGTVTVLDSANSILWPAEVSPDGSMLALFNIGSPQEDLFVTPAGTFSPRRITDDAARDRGPVWSPDNQSLIFYSTRGGTWEMWAINIDGGGLRKIIPLDGVVSPVIAPSFDRVVFRRVEVGISYIADVVNGVVPEGASKELPNSRLDDATFGATTWSADGRTLAGAVEARSGRTVGVATYDLASAALRKLNDDEGGWVRWLPGDRRVIYLTPNGDVVVFDTVSKTRTVAGTIRNAVLPFALAPDGRALYLGIERRESDVWIVERTKR